MKHVRPVLFAGVFVAAVLATIIALNFTSGEKQIRQELIHHYDVADPQFLRAMGVLLGPALVEGNRAIAAAARSTDLSMAYFVPDDVARDAMVEALRRGVRIRIILPGPIGDAAIVSDASRDGWGELLKNGAKIYEYQPTMYHCKVLVVDGLWTSVGSTNFDNRSFRLNDESNLNIYDRDFARRQTALFNDDLQRSRRVSYEEWLARPWTQKIRQKALTAFNMQL